MIEATKRIERCVFSRFRRRAAIVRQRKRLPAHRTRHGRQHGGGELLRSDPFEGVRVGKHGPQRFEFGRLQVDKGSRNLFTQGDAQGRDHSLAWIDRNVTEARGDWLSSSSASDHSPSNLNGSRWTTACYGGQEIDRPFDVALKRGRQRDGQAVEVGQSIIRRTSTAKSPLP